MSATTTAGSNHICMTNANFPVDDKGRVYHLGLHPGQMANRVITVGDASRAILIASMMDGGSTINPAKYRDYLSYSANGVTIITSKRNFTTITGRYGGTPVSIVAIGMGMPMMDFFVREARAIVQGPMHIVRFGSCGSVGRSRAGDVVVTTDSVLCSRNYDYDFAPQMAASMTPADQAAAGYYFSKSTKADAELTAAVAAALRTHVPQNLAVNQGSDVTTDSFYSSQGRTDLNFADANAGLFEHLAATYPHCESLQMESFMLLHLAGCVQAPASCAADTNTNQIRAAAFAMVFANRRENTWIPTDVLVTLEARCAKAALDAIVALPIGPAYMHPEAGSLWAASN